METEGKTLATVRLRLAAIAAAHRLGGHPDPTSRPLVQATQSRILTDHGLRDDRIFTDVASGRNMRRPAASLWVWFPFRWSVSLHLFG